jgi:hypothetical protein
VLALPLRIKQQNFPFGSLTREYYMTSHFTSNVGLFVIAGYWVLPENYLIHKSTSMSWCVCCSPLLPWICSYRAFRNFTCSALLVMACSLNPVSLTNAIKNGALRHVVVRAYQHLLHFLNISVDKKSQLDVTFVLFISLLLVAQHVSGNHVPIIRSWRLRDVITFVLFISLLLVA